MKYFSEKTGKLYESIEQLKQAEEKYAVEEKNKKEAITAEKQRLKEISNRVDKNVDDLKTLTAERNRLNSEIGLAKEALRKATIEYEEQKEKVAKAEVGVKSNFIPGGSSLKDNSKNENENINRAKTEAEIEAEAEAEAKEIIFKLFKFLDWA